MQRWQVQAQLITFETVEMVYITLLYVFKLKKYRLGLMFKNTFFFNVLCDQEYNVWIIGINTSIITRIQSTFRSFFLSFFNHNYGFQSTHNDATWFQEQQTGLHLWPMESDCFYKSYHEVQRYWKVTHS